MIARLEWRPSRVLVATLATFGVLAAIAVLASDLPTATARLLAVTALTHGVVLAWRESRKPVRVLVIAAATTRVMVDGAAVSGFAVDWRGTLAFARWRDGDGRRRRLVWWPDTLRHAARRELRLAVPAAAPARHAGSMAT